MINKSDIKDRWLAFLHSFPIQLVFHHVRRNLALLSVWVILLLAISGNLGRVYGIQYLFLDPEYLGRVNFWSFFIIGITFGMLTMAFHVTSYILDSHRFSFIGALERPFAKFAVNNTFIPLLVFLVYVFLIVRFQLNNEFKKPGFIITDLLGLLSGRIILQVLTFYYFRFTNKDIVKYLAGSVDKRLRKSGVSRDRMMKRLRESQQKKYDVQYYFDLRIRLRSTGDLEDLYDRQAVLKVFDQNQFNAVIIGLIIIGLILIMGLMDFTFLQIPAGASTMLMFTILLILIGAVSYWFRGWGLPFVIGLLIVVNQITTWGWTNSVHEAAGVNYDAQQPEYTVGHIQNLSSKQNYQADYESMISRLDAWKANQKEEKPRVVLMCVSGGGQRAALWTVNVLQSIDQALDESIVNSTALITGASGGMIGAAYYRELYLRSLEDSLNLGDSQWIENISKDNLNPVIFSLMVNDAFLGFRRFSYAGKSYRLDRGYAFERNLNRNIGNVLDKSLADYHEPESQGVIPTLLLSPTIANDGRKLYISTQPVTFMNINEETDEEPKIRGVDYLRLFEKNDPENIHFMTALRMSASFPYITPTISLPSEPRMEIMDAGISDNFGVSDGLRFMYIFREWLKQNTSGVALVIVRDTDPNEEVRSRPIPSLLGRISYPIASVYNNLAKIQDRKNDALLEQAETWYEGDLRVFEFVYTERYGAEEETERASLSWHLTKKERQSITEKINGVANQDQLKALKKFLDKSVPDTKK